MSYPPLLPGACLKLFEARGISTQKERPVGEVGAGAGKREPGAARPRQGVEPAWRTWLRVGCRRERRPGICGCGCLLSGSPLPAPPRGLEGKGRCSGSAGARGEALALPLPAAEGSLEAWTLAERGGETRAGGSRRLQGPALLLSASRRQRRDPRSWDVGGARSCGGRGLPPAPVFVHLGSWPPSWATRLAPEKTGSGGQKGGRERRVGWTRGDEQWRPGLGGRERV